MSWTEKGFFKKPVFMENERDPAMYSFQERILRTSTIVFDYGKINTKLGVFENIVQSRKRFWKYVAIDITKRGCIQFMIDISIVGVAVQRYTFFQRKLLIGGQDDVCVLIVIYTRDAYGGMLFGRGAYWIWKEWMQEKQ